MNFPLSFSIERRIHEAKKITPSPEYQESLKAFLFSQLGEKNEIWFSQKLPALESGEEFFSMKQRIWGNLQGDLVTAAQTPRWEKLVTFLKKPVLIGIVTILTSAFLGTFFTFRFLFGTPEQVIHENQLISASGEVFLNNTPLANNVGTIKISSNTTLSTKNGTARFSFFDDTFLILGENTSVSVRNSIPDPSFPDTGKIELHLEKGNIWVRTFTQPSREESVLIRSGDILITPLLAAIDVSRSGNEIMVRIWERSARISDRLQGRSSIFVAGRKVQFSSVQGKISDQINTLDTESIWIKKARKEDKEYTTAHFENILKTYKKEVGVLPDSNWYVLKKSLENTFFSPTTIQGNLERSKKYFQEAALLAETGNFDLATEQIIIASQKIQSFLQEFPEFEPWITHFFQRLKKDLAVIPNASQVKEIFPVFLASETEVFGNSSILIHRNLLEILWKVQGILLDGQSIIPRNIFESYTAQKELLPNIITESSEEKQKLLIIKMQELRLLDFLFFNLFAKREIEKMEDKIVEETLVLVEGKEDRENLDWNAQEFLKQENPVDVFTEKIRIYSTPQAQKNQMVRLLSAVDPVVRNLPFLQELHKQFENELRSVITDKMIEIMELEEQKAILEGS